MWRILPNVRPFRHCPLGQIESRPPIGYNWLHENSEWAVAALFAAVVAVSAPGGGFYLKFGATEWDKASSYCKDAGRTEAATTPPGSSDSIHVPAEVFTFDGRDDGHVRPRRSISSGRACRHGR